MAGQTPKYLEGTPNTPNVEVPTKKHPNKIKPIRPTVSITSRSSVMHTLAQPCMQAYDTCTHCSLAHPLHMSPHRPQRRQSDCLRVLARPHRLPRAGAACLLGVLPHSCLSAGYSLGAGTQYSLGAGTSVSVRLVRITAARRLLPPPGSSRLLYQSVPCTRLLEAPVPECTPYPASRGCCT